MLSFEAALGKIGEAVEPLPAARLPLNDVLGLVLAEGVQADLDSPPFDKALMDGYAIRAADVADGPCTLEVIAEVLAGRVVSASVRPGTAIRIMTGATVPQGADTVVPVEQTEIHGDGQGLGSVRILATSVKAEQNILRQGGSVRRGTEVLAAGTRLQAWHLGALAELGRGMIRVIPRPRAAVLATGDELVPVNTVPGPGQIRNSNETMLVAQLRHAGVETIPLGVARDTREDLRAKLAEGLRADVLLLSGGVSAGVLDLVPGTLRELGVREVFHKVHLRPGQPIWFGVRQREAGPGGESSRTYVFGLPGNPVSSMVCCELFAKTAIRRMMGVAPCEPQPMSARLIAAHQQRGTRPTFHPAWWEWQSGGVVARTVPWVGSADLCATVGANGMVYFPGGDATYPEGSLVQVYPW